jgi:hypothetical protein
MNFNVRSKTERRLVIPLFRSNEVRLLREDYLIFDGGGGGEGRLDFFLASSAPHDIFFRIFVIYWFYKLAVLDIFFGFAPLPHQKSNGPSLSRPHFVYNILYLLIKVSSDPTLQNPTQNNINKIKQLI